MTNLVASSESSESLAAVVGRLTAFLAAQDNPGLAAELRRDALSGQPGIGFYRLAVALLPENWEREAEAWLCFLAAVVILTPKRHRPGRGLGEALVAAKYSELRLERLLAAAPDVLGDFVLSVARYLKAKDEGFDFTDLLVLLLARRDDTREEIRRRIALQYAKS